MVAADILLSLDDPLESAGGSYKKRKRPSSQQQSTASSRSRKSRRITAGIVTKVARGIKKRKPANLQALYDKLDYDFDIGEERFVSLAKWLSTLRKKKKSSMEQQQQQQQQDEEDEEDKQPDSKGKNPISKSNVKKKKVPIVPPAPQNDINLTATRSL
jgi:Sec-independent protein translocase protein TatA